jgi:hypothetical protein
MCSRSSPSEGFHCCPDDGIGRFEGAACHPDDHVTTRSDDRSSVRRVRLPKAGLEQLRQTGFGRNLKIAGEVLPIKAGTIAPDSRHASAVTALWLTNLYVSFGRSRHNGEPSSAVDVAPMGSGLDLGTAPANRAMP